MLRCMKGPPTSGSLGLIQSITWAERPGDNHYIDLSYKLITVKC
jgi:hypothetical protein